MRPEITRKLKLTMNRLMLPHMDEILDLAGFGDVPYVLTVVQVE